MLRSSAGRFDIADSSVQNYTLGEAAATLGVGKSRLASLLVGVQHQAEC